MIKRNGLMLLLSFLSLLFSNQSFKQENIVSSVFEEQTVLHIGDSQVAGPYGYHLGMLIRSRGAERYIRHGEIGKGVFWWLNHQRLERILNRYEPDIVIITMGGNDTWRARYDLRTYKELVSTFIQILQTHCDRFVWVSPPTATGINSHMQVYRDLVSETILNNVGEDFFVDSRQITANISGRTGDGIHFTYHGGRLWAEQIIQQIERKLNNE